MTHQPAAASNLIESRSLLRASCDLEYILMGDVRNLLIGTVLQDAEPVELGGAA